MLITGHQPNYLPYTGFFHKVARSDLFIIVDNVQFVKRGPFGWQHRNRIRGADGVRWLTVPVKTSGRFHQRIIEVEIDNARPWGRKHMRSLEFAYREAPHYREYADAFQGLYAREWDRLADLNVAIIRHLLDVLGIRTPVRRTSEMGVVGEGTGLVVALCRAAGADEYLSGIHGRDYLDYALLRDEGIRVRYPKFRHPVYPQRGHADFVENLSAVDLLFNVGPAAGEMVRTAGGVGPPET
ncbi:MAG: WbqC family protein [Planctomycetota bacterium]